MSFQRRIPLKKPVSHQLFYRHLEAAAADSPSARIPLPKPIQPLHVYRHLLRASSYFPNACRPYLEDRIKSGFRRERMRATKAERYVAKSNDPKRAYEEEQYRRSKALYEGRKQLASLDVALAGDQNYMRRILQHCFGKLGRKRRELMASFTRPGSKQPPMDTQQLEEYMEEQEKFREEQEKTREEKEKLRKIHPHNRRYDREDRTPWVNQKLSPIEANWDLAKLRAYMRSQMEHQEIATAGNIWPRQKIAQIDPMAKIPKTDLWGRPTAARRVTKKVREWWKSSADRVMPPVGEEEWKFLRSLASGEASETWLKMPPRRPVAVPVAGEMEMGARKGWNWALHATVPVREIERPRSYKFARRTGKTDDGPYSQTLNRIHRGVPYSRRQLRRQFGLLWQASSYVKEMNNQINSEDGEKKKKKKTPRHQFVWGSPASVLPEASAAQRAIFEGVDAKGAPVG